MRDNFDVPNKDKLTIFAKMVRDITVVNNLDVSIKCQLEIVDNRITIWISEKK